MVDLNSTLPSELNGRDADQTAADFPSPWTIQELEACFVVIDSDGQKLAFIYHREEPGQRAAAKLPTKQQARQIAANIARLPGCCVRNVARHSPQVTFTRPAFESPNTPRSFGA